jgi:hypothetical protein
MKGVLTEISGFTENYEIIEQLRNYQFQCGFCSSFAPTHACIVLLFREGGTVSLINVTEWVQLQISTAFGLGKLLIYFCPFQDCDWPNSPKTSDMTDTFSFTTSLQR